MLLSLFIIGGNVYAANYTENDKKLFYDGFLGSFFPSLEQSLVAKGIPRTKAAKYTTALKGRVSRTKLENETWACVSKYTLPQLEQINEECFSKWVNSLIFDNKDLLQQLQ